MTTFNDDGISIKGCDVIYAPKGQAGEYAPLAANHYRGCGSRCTYCYVPGVIRMSREEFDKIAKAKPDYLARLRKDAAKYQAAGIGEQVLLCFTTDPYNPYDAEIGLTRDVIKVLTDYGLGFCTLTKGGLRALRDIDLFRPDRDAFATSLTFYDSADSTTWEAGASLPCERITALKAFHDAGIFTWVSFEPVIDPIQTLQLLEICHQWVDLFKVGQINYHRAKQGIDWQWFTDAITARLRELKKAHYVKADLQRYLPEGYENQLRQIQHH